MDAMINTDMLAEIGSDLLTVHIKYNQMRFLPEHWNILHTNYKNIYGQWQITT